MCLHIAGRCDVISAMTSHIVVAPNSINRARLAELRQTGRASQWEWERERREKREEERREEELYWESVEQWENCIVELV